MNSDLNAQLATAKRLLTEITEGEFAEHRWSVMSLMSTVFDLGTALGREPELARAEPVSTFLREAETRRGRLLLAVGLYVFETAHILSSSWADEEWFDVCRRRSSIEFLRTLLAVPQEDESLDTEDIDRQIRRRGDSESLPPPSGVDPGIPPSHWWWWFPDPPPSR